MRVECYQKVRDAREAVGEITLDFEARTRSRGKTVANNGSEVAWFLEQGEFLRDGESLVSESDESFRVRAAPEPVSRVTSEDPLLLMRVAYHLGNRHVPLCVEKDYLLYQPDYVLDDMVKGLGAEVSQCELPFQPEDGAYHSHEKGGHSHSHEREHSHD